MAISLLFGRKEPGRIGEVILDARINENHDYSNEVTSFPVEDGSDISDHVKRAPERITIDGFVTNTPIQFLGGTIGRSIGVTPENRVQDAFEKLIQIAGYDYPDQVQSGTATPGKIQLVDVVTGLRVYHDMVISRLSIPRNSRTGDALRFTAELVRIRFTTSELVFISNTSEKNVAADRVNDQAASTVDTGTQAPSQVDRSKLKSLFDKTNSLVAGLF